MASRGRWANACACTKAAHDGVLNLVQASSSNLSGSRFSGLTRDSQVVSLEILRSSHLFLDIDIDIL